jgi:hypothetical protein
MGRTAIQGDSYSLQVFLVSVLVLFRSTDNAAGTKTAFQGRANGPARFIRATNAALQIQP